MLPVDLGRKIWEVLPVDLGRKIWEVLPVDRKNPDFLDSFKSEIKNWRRQECPCKLCKRYIHQVDFTQISKWFWLLTTPSTLLKKRLWHKCFPVIFVKFLRTPFLQNISGDCFSDFVIQVPPLPLSIMSRNASWPDRSHKHCVRVNYVVYGTRKNVRNYLKSEQSLFFDLTQVIV